MSNEVDLKFFGGPYLTKIKGKEFELKEFTIAAELWAEKKFGSLAKLLEGISGQGANLSTQLELLHYLMKDKTIYPTPEALADALNYEDFAECFEALTKCVSDALYTLKKRADMAMKKKNALQADSIGPK
jgi:hypothetical protein